jgi:hypothetical protein
MTSTRVERFLAMVSSRVTLPFEVKFRGETRS